MTKRRWPRFRVFRDRRRAFGPWIVSRDGEVLTIWWTWHEAMRSARAHAWIDYENRDYAE